MKSIPPAGVCLYLGLFEPRLILSRGPGRGGHTLTSPPPQGQRGFDLPL